MFTAFLNTSNAPFNPGAVNGSTVGGGGWSGVPLGTVGSTAGGEAYVKVGAIGVSAKPYQYSGTASFGAGTGGTTAITAFTVAAGGVGFIQNNATAPLLVKFGTGAATNSYSMILKGAGTASDGTGGFVYINDRTGPVSAFPASGTSNFICWADT